MVNAATKLLARFSLHITLLCCVVLSHNAVAQNAQQATLLLSPDTACTIVFDGDFLGTVAPNNIRKIKADLGDHILNATFYGNKTVKKIISVKSTNQVIITIAAPPKDKSTAKPAAAKTTTKPTVKSSPAPKPIDTTHLTKATATQLYKEELLTQSPQDINKLKYYLAKGADVHATSKYGWSLLHEAAYQGDTAVINFCLKNKLPVNAKCITNRTFYTPLGLAKKYNRTEAVKLLLQNKAEYGVADGYAEVEYDSSNRYKGDFKNGLKDGHGIFYFANGTIYDGHWKDDEENGKGTITWSDGDKYEGDWVKGWRQGQGVYTMVAGTNAGDKYVGHFEKNDLSGQGIFYYPDGSWYDGNFKDNKKQGYGISHFKGGAKYMGNWVDDAVKGKGIYYEANGTWAEGEWTDENRNGYVTLHWPDGSKYIGNLVNGQMAGNGIIYYTNGNRYEGHMENNQRSGQGNLYCMDGSKYVGNWSNDAYNGQGTFYYTEGGMINGSTYTGQWVNNQKSGYGEYTVSRSIPDVINNCALCKIYKGYWANDLKNGQGSCYDVNNKLIFEGQFINDSPIGAYPNR